MNEKIINDISERNLEVMMSQLLTEKEAAVFLRISGVTLWRERTKGKIAFHRVASRIVYTQEDLENYLNRNKREAFGIEK